MRVEFNFHHNVQVKSYVFQRLVWILKNASKQWCGRESIDAFLMKKKTHTFENVLVKTGPKVLKKPTSVVTKQATCPKLLKGLTLTMSKSAL